MNHIDFLLSRKNYCRHVYFTFRGEQSEEQRKARIQEYLNASRKYHALFKEMRGVMPLRACEFEYAGEWQSGCYELEIQASLTMTLSVLFNQNGESSFLGIKNYGYEFDAANEDDVKVMRSMYIKVGDDYYTLDKVMEYAEKELRDILDDVEREARSDAAHAREMSSPYLTGRV